MKNYILGSLLLIAGCLRAMDGVYEFVPYPPTTVDSPLVVLEQGYKKYSANESFTAWVMYIPEGNDVIPIPIASLDWSWSGVATKTNSIWGLTSSSNSQNPSGTATSTFPEWKGLVQDLQWKKVE